MAIPAEAIQRYAATLDTLMPADARIGVAVSGGPDSLALLLLTAAARPGSVMAATVDHGLRKEATAEAAMVAELCATLGVPHTVLTADWLQPPTSNIQAAAREMRYRLLTEWADRVSLAAIATAHHADDQAETLLMRLSRGAGLSGLAGIRSSRPLSEHCRLIRPLLGWRKVELEAVVYAAGQVAVDDPSNRDEAYDRTRVRTLLSVTDWLSPDRIAASVAALAESDDALRWMTVRLAEERMVATDGGLTIDPSGLPPEILRRLMHLGFARLRAPVPRGPDLERAIVALQNNNLASLSGLLLRPGTHWSMTPEPPRAR